MATLSVAKYIPASSEARRILEEALSGVAAVTKANETGVTQCIVCEPVDAGDDGPIVTITTFADASAHQTHVSSQSVRDFFDSLEKNTLLAKPMEVHRLAPIAGFHKPTLKDADRSKAFVLFAHSDMHPGAWEKCSPAIHAVCDHCEKNEPGTLAFDICKSAGAEGEQKGYAVEMYENAEYFQDPHMKNEAAQEVVKQIGENADFRDWLQMRVIGGFLAK